MRNNHFIFFLVLTSLCMLASIPDAFAQSTDTIAATRGTKERHVYLQLGGSQVVFRDFATSPLFYGGLGMNSTLGATWKYPNGILDLRGTFRFATPLSQPVLSDFFPALHSSLVIHSTLEATYLRHLKRASGDKTTYFVGGGVIADLVIRNNQSLQNNSFASDAFVHLAGAGKVERNISRTEEREQKIWFIKRTLKPVKRYLDFNVLVGLLNFNYRPGYAYSDVPEIDGSNTTIWDFQLEGYQWSLNGWRLHSEVQYRQYAKNGNAFALGYRWEAMHAPGQHEAFQQAWHHLFLTFYVNTK